MLFAVHFPFLHTTTSAQLLKLSLSILYFIFMSDEDKLASQSTFFTM